MIEIDKYRNRLYRYYRSVRYNYSVLPGEILKLLLESQYWPKQKLDDFQLKSVNKLLNNSINSSKYYKKILTGIELPLKRIRELDIKIPILSKDDIKEQYSHLKTEHFFVDFKHSTSGTSGDPITIYTSGLAEAYREAGFSRFLDWWNIQTYDKSVLIKGKKATTTSGNFLIEKVKKKFTLRYDINIFDLNTQTIDKYYKNIKKFKPVFIRGYKSAILQFAELLEQKSLTFDNFKFKVAIVTAEILLKKERQYLEKILDCKVANEYGSAEVGQISFECPNGSMHVFEEAVYLSTNKNNDVFVTEIHNNCMPLINYKINDRVIFADYHCKCGRNSRIISKIVGRENDYVLKPNGAKISAIEIIFIFMELDDIGLSNTVHKFKIIQRKNKFLILIVATQKYNEKVEEYIKSRFYEEIGKEIIIEFDLVESIPRDESGKLRFFSRID